VTVARSRERASLSWFPLRKAASVVSGVTKTFEVPGLTTVMKFVPGM
jgi:hypothetical protein